MPPAGGYHELLHGPEKQDAVRFLSEWILSHSGPQQVKINIRVYDCGYSPCSIRCSTKLSVVSMVRLAFSLP